MVNGRIWETRFGVGYNEKLKYVLLVNIFELEPESTCIGPSQPGIIIRYYKIINEKKKNYIRRGGGVKQVYFT